MDFAWASTVCIRGCHTEGHADESDRSESRQNKGWLAFARHLNHLTNALARENHCGFFFSLCAEEQVDETVIREGLYSQKRRASALYRINGPGNGVSQRRW
jgi:hypothetical protein